MPSANLLKQWMWTGVSFVAVSFVATNQIYALTAHQTCQQGSLCTIGEFVYTDAAVPITDATCQFTSFDPSGSSFVNAASLTGTADGWYAYSFTPTLSTTVGTYPSQLCCQTSENDLCIDKTFSLTAAPTAELTTSDISGAVWNATLSGYTQPGSTGEKIDQLQNNSLSAADIWGYSGRTLSSFGNLISDLVSGVWNAPTTNYTTAGSFGQQIDQSSSLTAEDVWEYNNRSLSSFGNLVTSIWSADDRTATDPNGATATSITVLEREVKTAQTLIQSLSLQSSIVSPSSDTPDYAALLDAKLETTKDYLSEISNHLEIISTRLGLLAVKWDQLSDTDRIQELEVILTLLGTTDSSDMDTLIGQLGWFVTNWPKTSTSALYQDVTHLRTDINDFITAIQISPSDSTQVAIINQLFAAASSFKTDVGDISQSQTATSLYGQYKSNRSLSEALAGQLRIISNALADWDRLSLTDRDTLVNTLATDIDLLNRFSALKTLLSPLSSTPTYLNSLKSVIIANQAALAAAGSPVVVNWIGADATAFHTFIYNPSKTVPQTIPINYFLPTELTTEDLSLTPAALTTTFNPDQNAVAVTGSPSLDPEAHSLYTIISTDIWDINPTELESFRFQANSLATSLERSSVYPQANTLRQNINTALDTILSLQQQTRTPEAKIQTYRQIQTLHQSVSQGIQELQNLANSNQSSNSLMGFIGGVQAVAVWGMIVIVIAGFIFLSLYMRALYQQTQVEINGEPEISLPLSGPILALPSPHQISASQTEWSRIHLPLSFNLNALTQRKFSFSLVIFSAVLLSTIVLKQQSSLPRNNQVIIAPLEPTVTPSPSPSPLPPPSPSPTPTASPSATILIVPPGIGDSVDLRRLPTTNSSVITSITLEEIATIATQSGDWLQVTLTTREPVLTGWLNRNLALIISN